LVALRCTALNCIALLYSLFYLKGGKGALYILGKKWVQFYASSLYWNCKEPKRIRFIAFVA
jgi:hypothetical protein